mgnify:CR=1 FL=1
MIVVDGMSDFYRHYWKIQRVVGPNVAGFMGMIRGVFSYKKQDKDVRIVWEGKSTIRKNINVLYKGDRKRMPDTFYEQLNDTQSFLSHFFKQYMVEEYESDDLCATIAYKRNRIGKTTKIISGDGDIHQIINENISVYNPARDIEVNVETFKDEYGPNLLSHHLLGLWALEGDASDNIIGIKGLKKRSELVAAYFPDYALILSDIEFEDVAERFYKALIEDKKGIMTPKDKAKVMANKKLIYDNMNLIRLRLVPKEFYKRIETRDDPKALIEKYKCFKSLMKYLEEPNENKPATD